MAFEHCTGFVALELCRRELQHIVPRKCADIHAALPGLRAVPYPRVHRRQRGVVVVADGGLVAVAQGGKAEGFLVDKTTSSPLRCRLFPENHPDRCGSVRNLKTSGSGNPARLLPAHRCSFVPYEKKKYISGN